MAIRKEVLDELLKEYKTPPDLFGQGGILKQLTTPYRSQASLPNLSYRFRCFPNCRN
jgi:hypothetical protein